MEVDVVSFVSDMLAQPDENISTPTAKTTFDLYPINLSIGTSLKRRGLLARLHEQLRRRIGRVLSLDYDATLTSR